MNHFVSRAHRNRQLFGYVHAAKRIANQPLVHWRVLHRLILAACVRFSDQPSQKTLEKPNAPGEHQQPKQIPEDASQNPHVLLPRQQAKCLPPTVRRVYAGGKGCVKRKCVISIGCEAGWLQFRAAFGAINQCNLLTIKELFNFIAKKHSAVTWKPYRAGMRSIPIYGRNASGIPTDPSACW